MPGFFGLLSARSRLLELGLRLLIASALAIGLMYSFERPIVRTMIPMFHDAMRVVATEFTISSVEIAPEGPSESLRFFATLSQPLEFAGRTLYPSNWDGDVPKVAFKATATLGGVLQYAALALIVVLAWPAAGIAEFALRLGLSLPLLAALLMVGVPFTIPAEFWGQLRDSFDPQAFCGWMVWSRFLMGGGGVVLAGLVATLAICGGRRLLQPRRQATRERGYARLILSTENSPPRQSAKAE